MNRTKIDWATHVWNPIVGCTGTCPYCYARRIARRFHRDFTPHWEERNFCRPFPQKPARIFVNSMSDLADWTMDWFDKVTARIAQYPEHRFLFLSKRPWDCAWTTLANAMLGYSVTRQDDLERLILNGGLGGPVSFLSIEPLLDRVEEPTLWTPHWIIVGAETGNRRERVIPKLAWLVEIMDFTMKRGIPLFFKDSLRAIWPAGADNLFPREFPRGIS